MTEYPEVDPALPCVAIDFDGVLADATWPEPRLGAVNRDALDMVEHYFNQNCEVIIFTARPESHHRRIWAWLAYHGADHMIYDVTRQKPVASLYFDDRAVRWPLT